MKKLKLFLYNVKNSWFFLMVIFIELVLCITLLSVALSNFLGSNSRFAYYNKNVADKSFVTFEGYSLENDTSVQTISQYLSDDLSTLATTVKIGRVLNDSEDEVNTPLVTIATPALTANFNSKGLKFSKKLASDYRECYVDRSYSEMYKVGNIYEITVDNYGDIYTQKVKILGYFDGTDYYVFSDGFIMFSSSGMVVCDELPLFATLSSGIFVNDKGVDFYKNLGFKALAVEDYYSYEKEGSPFMNYLYLAIIIMLFTFVTILCNYILSIDKMSKRSAVLYACGSKNSTNIIIEGIKMLFIYLLSFAISIGIAEIIIAIGKERQNILITRPNFYLSALVVLGIYLLAIIIGFVKFARAKPLKVLGYEKK